MLNHAMFCRADWLIKVGRGYKVTSLGHVPSLPGDREVFHRGGVVSWLHSTEGSCSPRQHEAERMLMTHFPFIFIPSS